MKKINLFVVFFFLVQAAFAGVLDNGNMSSNTAAQPLAATEFLPVHQAYRADIELRENQILLHWDIAEGYYLYGEQFSAELLDKTASPPQVRELEIVKEKGLLAYDDYFEREVEKFYSATTLILNVISKPPVPSSNDNLILTVGFQGCAEAGLCYPPQSLFYRVDIENGVVEQLEKAEQSVFADSVPITEDRSLLLMVLFAVMGGLILNLMPCVFPVLSIKILSFISLSHSAKHLQWHGWAYTAGIICSMLVLAMLLMLLRGAGEVIGWGFQLQSPVFIAFLVYLFFLLALSLSGLFVFGGNWMGIGQQLTERKGLQSAFFTGILAVLVSSPCSVPFMGVALGYALTQPVFSASVIFAALGFGLAIPFLLLSYFPGLIDRLPKPGPWMERFKQFLAFPLYFTVVWLLWVLGHQSGSDAVAVLLVGLVLLVFAIWLMKMDLPGEPVSAFNKIFAAALVITAMMLPFANIVSSQNNLFSEKSSATDGYWQAYSREKFAAVQTEGKPIFIELTADWCITCLMNEKVALSKQAVIAAMENKGVVYLRGDWTNGDPEITELLRFYQRGGVPLYLFFAAGVKVPIIMPQLLTEEMVLETIDSL